MEAPERRSVTLITTRTLVLMRHAKSGYPDGVGDHDRPLAPRGRREGALAGDWLRRHVPPVDAVLCSSATRTRETVAVANLQAPIRLADQIYEAHPDDILEQIRQTGNAVTTLVVVGHAPGMPGLALQLSGSRSLDEPLRGLHTRFPTAAMAVLETAVEWADLQSQDGALIDFHIPRS